ncbi:CAP domain-containing protein [Lipingzhangella sp. LS1_29]|uniref:CAP domain-containing protein n=1 Tax=Lipingzhangella rawalii TaxID=2055835 RepID=A0ABU2H8P0_9ACTN|nr:CAP domain-containing protein [Lipingzhangella rawalii]MDS1271205.1 CAP domain-containing protein [Lipingzhangella rawalii]
MARQGRRGRYAGSRRRSPGREASSTRSTARWGLPLLGALLAVPAGIGVAGAMTVASFPQSDDHGSAGATGPNVTAEDEETLSPEEFFDEDGGTVVSADPPDAPPPSPENTSEEVTVESSDTDDDEDDSEDPDAQDTDAPEEGSSSPGSVSATSHTVVDLVNAERAEEGCGPLRVDDRLASAAQAHSEDMAERDYVAHVNPDDEEPAERAAQHGYHAYAAENVAAGQGSAQAVVNSWMNSSGHRENILNCDFASIGVGEHERYWTQKFGWE